MAGFEPTKGLFTVILDGQGKAKIIPVKPYHTSDENEYGQILDGSATLNCKVDSEGYLYVETVTTSQSN